MALSRMTGREIDTHTLFLNPELSINNDFCRGLKLGINQSCLLFVPLLKGSVSDNTDKLNLTGRAKNLISNFREKYFTDSLNLNSSRKFLHWGF